MATGLNRDDVTDDAMNDDPTTRFTQFQCRFTAYVCRMIFICFCIRFSFSLSLNTCVPFAITSFYCCQLVTTTRVPIFYSTYFRILFYTLPHSTRKNPTGRITNVKTRDMCKFFVTLSPVKINYYQQLYVNYLFFIINYYYFYFVFLFWYKLLFKTFF